MKIETRSRGRISLLLLAGLTCCFIQSDAAPQSCVSPPSGLVGWWAWENNGNDIADADAATLFGGPSFVAGKVGQALQLEGNPQTAIVPATPTLNVGAGNGFTVEAWINPDDVSSAQPIIEWNGGASSPFFFDSDQGIGVHFWLAVAQDGGGNGSLYTNLREFNGANHVYSTPQNLVVAGAWNHVAFTYDKTVGNGTLTVYVNGAVARQATNVGVFTPQTTYPLNFGSRIQQSTNYYFGGLDEVGVYNRVLSPAEIAGIYNADSSGKCRNNGLAASIAVSSSLNPSDVGQQVTFTATVTGAGTPTGTVQFKDSGNNIGAPATLNGGGVATFATSALTAGTHRITAQYSGDSNFATSAATLPGGQIVGCASSANLVASYSAEGNRNDNAGPTFEDGTAFGTPRFVLGKVGQAFDFTGNNSVRLGSPTALQMASALTVETWIRPVSGSSGQTYGIVSRWVNSFALELVFQNGFLNLRGEINTNGAGGNHQYVSDVPGSIPLNTWTHVAMTFNSSTGTLAFYINGAPAGSTSTVTDPLTNVNASVYIGERAGSNFFIGQIDEVGIFNRALSASEVAGIFNAGTAGKCKATDANLSNLTLSSGTLTPAFSSNTLSYTASVANAVTSITVTPTAPDSNTRITVNGSLVASGTASSAINLAVGNNTITIGTTAQDGNTTKLYSVVVNRAGAGGNTNANLSNLTLSAGAISPAFDVDTLSYTLSVPNATTSTTVTPTLADSNATVKVNGQTVASGTPSSAITLNVGANTINTVVTAQDGTTMKTYTVTVTRAKFSSSTAVMSSINPSNFGQQVTFTATVTSSGGTPTGTVQFKDNGTNIGSAASLNGSGVATVATSSLSIGTHTITGDYNGDSNFLTSTGTLSGGQVVNGSCIAAPANMVAWYPAENNSNDIAGPTSENGSISGSGVTFVTGNVGLGYNFTGSGFVTMGTPAPLVITGNQVTLDGWINPSATDSGTRIFFGRSASAQNDYTLLANSGLLSGSIKTGGVETFVNATQLPANTWSHIALTYDGTTIKIFRNGVVVASAAKTGNINNDPSSPFVIGGRSGGTNNFLGKIDEVEVFNRALSDTEVANIYNAGSAGKCIATDANLSNLTLSAGTLSPTFAAGTTSYTASVANSVTSLTVTPTAAESNARITVNGTAVTSGSASGAIGLNVGNNTITTVVTAQDGTTTKTYTVVVNRAVNTNANLSNLVLSAGAISPAFNPATTSYTLTVPFATTSTTVTPTVADSNATVKVNGQTVASGTASNSISLNPGSNTIDTIVTAQDGSTTKTYTVTVTRSASSNANLSNLVLSAGAISPTFTPATTSYTLNVPDTTASTTVTPTVADSTATVTVNGNPVTSGTASGSISLNFGPNTITTVVTAQDGTTTKTYTVTVTRAKIATTTAVVSSLNPSHFAQQVTFTATVTSSPTATGTVQFKDGGSNVGSAVSLDGSGVAALMISTLTPGTHAITADYSGDASHTPSTGTLSGGQVVTCFEPPNNLVAWYPAEGTLADIAGPTFEGGTAVGTSTFATGEVGQAFSFNGSNNYINVGSPTALKLSTAVTIDAWVRPTSLPAPGVFMGVVTKWAQVAGAGASSDSFALWLQNNGGTLQVFSAIHLSNTNEPALSGGNVPLNTFTHVAMTYDSVTGVFAIYVNGVVVGSTTTAKLPLTGPDSLVNIGHENSSQPRFFSGQIDEVEIFSRALSATEIANLYNSSTTGKCKHGLVQLSAATYSVSESGSNATITLTRTEGSADGVSVTLNTSNGTAIAGSDYTAQNNVVVTWADGDSANKTVQIPITNDTLFEPNETFNVTLSNPTGGAQLGPQATAVVTIVENDSPPEIAVEQPAGVNLADGGSVDFAVRTGTSLTKTFTIRNVSTSDLTITSVTRNGASAADFAIDTTAMANTLTPNASTTFIVTCTPSADGARLAVLHIASDDAASPFDVNLNGRGLTAIEAWRLEHFGDPDNSGPGADNSDFDKDGLNNDLEYATDSDPTASSPPVGTLDINGSNLEFSYKQSKAAVADGFTFAVQWSNSITPPNWNSVGVTETIVGETSTAYLVKATVSRGVLGRRFVRLQVTPPPP